MRARSTLLVVLTVLTMLAGCQDAKTTQATVPVNEEKTILDSGKQEETEVPIIVPPPITTDIDEQPSKPTMLAANMPPAITDAPENERALSDRSGAKQSNNPRIAPTTNDAKTENAGVSEKLRGKSNAVNRTVYPKELRGVWDMLPYGCSTSKEVSSDTRFEIRARFLQGYENTDRLDSIRLISKSPLAWRVVSISNIAPIEIQGDADIYILEGNNLTISNGSTAETYIRCK